MRHIFLLPVLALFLLACTLSDLFSYVDIDRDVPAPLADANSDTAFQTWAEGESCYSDFSSLPSLGITPGIQAVVSLDENRSLELRDHHTALQAIGTLNHGDTVTILDGPYCYETRNGGSRWWYVQVDATGIQAYVDEFSRLYGAIDIYLEPLNAVESPLVLEYFTVSVPSAFSSLVLPQDTIQISWVVRGAEQVSLFRQDTAELIASEHHGTLDFLLPAQASITFRLLALASDGTQIEETRQLSIDCADCNTQRGTTVSMALQLFENGRMLYRTDASLIYVLDNNGRAWTFPDTWQGADLTITEVPPSGYYQPQMGFGNIWLNSAGIRDVLGWAIAPESYFNSELIILADSSIELSLPDATYITITGDSWQYRP